MTDLKTLQQQLSSAVRAGRVASSSFLEPNDAATLAASLRSQDVQVSLTGGFSGARRRVVMAFPEHIPEAKPKLNALYFSGLSDETLLRAKLLEQGVKADQLGDVLQHEDGLSIVVGSQVAEQLIGSYLLDAPLNQLQQIPLERLESSQAKTQQAVVPSLRVDALGAKAFKVSRSYFAKGIAAGNVFINGKAASKASSAEEGDEIFADGLGRFSLKAVQGHTKKGNMKVVLEVETRR